MMNVIYNIIAYNIIIFLTIFSKAHRVIHLYGILIDLKSGTNYVYVVSPRNYVYIVSQKMGIS